MNIAWATVRHWDDLCSTTTHALAQSMVDNGHQLTIMNADPPEKHNEKPWTHVSLRASSFPGRKASSMAVEAKQWFRSTHAAFDLVIVDWPLAPKLSKTLQLNSTPTLLMDRSPPADATILGRLQWIIWKRAWGRVKRGAISSGLVVSDAHRTFVQQKTGVHADRLHVLPAGVNLDAFSPNPPSMEDGWKFVYHGRLDKHRGVLALPMLIQHLKAAGIAATLSLVGEGDAMASLESIAENNPWITVSTRLDPDKMAEHLAVHHIGLLPMPATKVWSIASPLKRSEYLAAGLMIYGVDHDGHRLKKSNPEWCHLVEQSSFHKNVIPWLKDLTDEDRLQRSQAARQYAELNATWETAFQNLEQAIQSTSNAS